MAKLKVEIDFKGAESIEDLGFEDAEELAEDLQETLEIDYPQATGVKVKVIE